MDKKLDINKYRKYFCQYIILDNFNECKHEIYNMVSGDTMGISPKSIGDKRNKLTEHGFNLISEQWRKLFTIEINVPKGYSSEDVCMKCLRVQKFNKSK